MKRTDAIAHIRVAGYHNDHQTALRLHIDSTNRVGFEAYKKAWREGQQAKRDGMPCGCGTCKKEKDNA